jgi:uncharacterized protein YjbI with pentapeptide repeats
VADPEHLKLLRRGVGIWNAWRAENPAICPDLTEADISQTNWSGVKLTGATLNRADMRQANLSGVNLTGATLNGADLNSANLSGADLSRADLILARLVEANLENATLTDCIVFGISAWGVKLKPFAMLQDLWTNYPDRVFRPIHYSSVDALIASLDEKIIRPAEARFVELVRRKAETMRGEHV